MELQPVLNWFMANFQQIFSFLNDTVVFTFNGLSVSWLSIIGAFLITGFVVSLFWKGART